MSDKNKGERIALVLAPDGSWVLPVGVPAGTVFNWWDDDYAQRRVDENKNESWDGDIAPHVYVRKPAEGEREDRLRAIEARMDTIGPPHPYTKDNLRWLIAQVRELECWPGMYDLAVRRELEALERLKGLDDVLLKDRGKTQEINRLVAGNRKLQAKLKEAQDGK